MNVWYTPSWPTLIFVFTSLCKCPLQKDLFYLFAASHKVLLYHFWDGSGFITKSIHACVVAPFTILHQGPQGSLSIFHDRHGSFRLSCFGCVISNYITVSSSHDIYVLIKQPPYVLQPVNIFLLLDIMILDYKSYIRFPLLS